ncbi:hypothetical protein P7M20_27310, partial [Vibrio parahaemolyticus]|nr:hypothetical protein [Vibrio parahaemolyticus]
FIEAVTSWSDIYWKKSSFNGIQKYFKKYSSTRFLRKTRLFCKPFLRLLGCQLLSAELLSIPNLSCAPEKLQ